MFNFLITAVIFVCFALTISQASPFNDIEKEKRLVKSEEIRKYLNESADPCNDFYIFACGNWQIDNRANEEEPLRNVLSSVNKEFEFKLKEILENTETNFDGNEQKVKDLYESCLKRQPEEEVFKAKLQEIVEEFGKIPFIEGDKWEEDNFDWLETVAKISQKYGINIIIGYNVIPYPQDVSINRVLVGHEEFDFPLPLYLNISSWFFWKRYQEKVASNLKSYFNLDSSLANETAQEITELEARLAKGAAYDRYGPDEYQIEITVRKLQQKYEPHLDLQRYLQIAYGSVPKDFVLERNEGYQQNLIEVLKTTPKKTIANYIFYKLAQRFGSSDSSCIVETRRHFLNLLENMWYRRTNMEAMERVVSNMFEDLKSVLYLSFRSKEYKWINPRVRRYILEKLNALSIRIYNYDKLNFTQEYGTLNLSRTDYLENLKSLYALKAQRSREKIYKTLQPYYDSENMPSGPKYIRNENCILIPLASLQPHLFRSDIYPNAINYGQLGSLLAHEMLHAFDDESRFADKYGNEFSWWDHRSSVFFDDRTECFREQYRKYSYAGHHWPDSIVQSENIADNGGIRLAYHTYVAWYEYTFRLQTNIDQEQLPDLQYKNKRLFFIAYAQTLCADTHPDYYPFVLASEYSPPENLRVLGALSNLEEFSEVFLCHRSSAMNPENRCKLF